MYKISFLVCLAVLGSYGNVLKRQDDTTGEYIKVDGTWYYIDADAKTIDDAYSACSGMSGKLWEPNTLDIMDEVHAQVLSLGLEDIGIWVGLTDEGSDGEWYFKSTGESFPFEDNQAPWRSDEPNNLLGDEACAKMNSDSPMEIYDVLCTDGRTQYAICELGDETTGEFVEVEGTWYFIDKDAKTINDAYSACSGMSGKLWEPNTLDIMNGVHAQVLSLGLENVGIWVGITDEGSDGEFYYKSTGESFPFEDNQAPWRSDEPDNRLGDEACAKMNADSPMEMYDVLCTDGRTMYAICEL